MRISSSSGGKLVERVYIEALVMGLCIGIAAVVLNYWLNDESWRLRLFALFTVGAALCVLQYALGRIRRR